MLPVVWERGVFGKLLLFNTLCIDFECRFSDYIIVECDFRFRKLIIERDSNTKMIKKYTAI